MVWEGSRRTENSVNDFRAPSIQNSRMILQKAKNGKTDRDLTALHQSILPVSLGFKGPRKRDIGSMDKLTVIICLPSASSSEIILAFQNFQNSVLSAPPTPPPSF